jgi:endo-1,4-beta-xylanase
MKNYSGDFAAILDDHVTTIAGHFKGRVVSWDEVNEAIDESNNCWRNV